MATVEKPTRVRNVAEASRRVLDPLQRLRGYIRLYVSIEAAAIVLLCVFACCWFSFMFDYGTFRMPWVGFDWVQELPWTSPTEAWQQSGFLALIGAVVVNVFRLLPLTLLLFLVLILIAAKAVNRLLQRFRDSALALELERRFPKILGDRLITAVELANRKKVIEQGYSPEMVDETIVEAAHRVEKLPIKEVFHWGRLWRMGFLVLCLTFGMYVLMGGVFAGFGYFKNRESVGASFGDYHEVVGIWFERNFLMENTIWPRRSHLVVVDPEEADLRIGRDRATPSIRVRAWEYVVADSKSREGWRPLTWKDLQDKSKTYLDMPKDDVKAAPPDWKVRDDKAGLTVDEVVLFFRKFDVRKGDHPDKENGTTVYHFPGGKTLPYQWAIADTSAEEGWRPLTWKSLNSDNFNGMAIPALPSGWEPPLTPSTGYTVDEVAAAMARLPEPPDGVVDNSSEGDVRNILKQLERYNAMRTALDRLEPRIADPGVRRSMRKLIVPSTVTVLVQGKTTKSTVTLTATGDNEFTGQFGDLREKNANEAWAFTYRAYGEDYRTPERKLTLVPPPSLINLDREDVRPAYLYYLPGGKSNAMVDDIKGKKQPLERSKVTLMGGDLVTVDCPAGTDLTLFGESDKSLKSVRFTSPGDKQTSVDLVDENGHKLATLTVPGAIEYIKKALTEPNLPEVRRVHYLERLAKYTEMNAHAAEEAPDPVVTLDGGTTFHVTLPNVRQDRLYVIEMVDTDNVHGLRKLKIRVTRDTEPSVDLAIDNWVRKTKDGYVVTAKARIPFTGNIKDDNGLSKVNYVYTVSKIESTAVLDVKALFFASDVVGIMAPADLGGALHGTTFMAQAWTDFEKAKNAQAPDSKDIKYYPAPNKSIKRFEDNLLARPNLYIPRAEIEKFLSKPQSAAFRGLDRDFKFEPDPMSETLEADPVTGDFPVSAIPSVQPIDGKVQPRYRLNLWVEATDNDLDSTKAVDGIDGPKTGTSKERFSIVIVPEDELMQLIGQDEAEQSNTLSNALDKLQEVREKLSVLSGDLGSNELKPQGFSPLSVRAELLEQTTDSAKASAKEVLLKYEAIFKELKGNDIEGNKKRIVLNEIVVPLQKLDKYEFDDGKGKLHDLRNALEFTNDLEGTRARSQKSLKIAQAQIQDMIDAVQGVLDKMQKQIEINKILDDLRKIKQTLQREKEIIDEVKRRAIDALLDGTLKDPEPKPKEKP